LETDLKRLLSITLLAAAAAGPASAHHSYSMFDHAKMYVWEGTVVDFKYMSPHSHLTVKVGEDGNDANTVGTWDIEAPAPNILSRQGWTRTTFRPGDKIVAVGQPLRDGRKGGALYYALKDGKRFYADVNRRGGPGANGQGVPPGVELP
jgi:hypothetical protein